MKPALKAILFVLLSAVGLTGLATATFIGFGVLLARWLPLSLFQASGLTIGAALAVAAVIHVITAMMQGRQAYNVQGDYEYEDDDEDEEDSDAPDGDPVFIEPDFSKAKRNDYCPCGSGKKFKNCCEHSTIN